MLRALLSCIAIHCVIPFAAAQEFPCAIAAKVGMANIGFLGYDKMGEVKQPASHKILLQCLSQYRVCLMLSNGKVITAQSPSDVRIKSRQIVIGVTQTNRGASRNYCTTGQFFPSTEEGPLWFYSTFAPNGDGFIAEGDFEYKGTPKTSAELFALLDKSFRHSIKEHRQRATGGEESYLKDLGYRDGEKP